MLDGRQCTNEVSPSDVCSMLFRSRYLFHVRLRSSRREVGSKGTYTPSSLLAGSRHGICLFFESGVALSGPLFRLVESILLISFFSLVHVLDFRSATVSCTLSRLMCQSSLASLLFRLVFKHRHGNSRPGGVLSQWMHINPMILLLLLIAEVSLVLIVRFFCLIGIALFVPMLLVRELIYLLLVAVFAR